MIVFRIHFKRTFYSTTSNEKYVDTARKSLLILINVGHLAFGLSQFYVLDHRTVVYPILVVITIIFSKF